MTTRKKSLGLCFIFLCAFAFQSLAQSDGVAAGSSAADGTSSGIATGTAATAASTTSPTSTAASALPSPLPATTTHAVQSSAAVPRAATPRPSASQATTSPTLPPTSTTPASPTNTSENSNEWMLWAIAAASVVAGLAALAARAMQKAKAKDDNSATNDDGRCDTIKQLLEKKKRELEEMIRDWPQEKVQEMAKRHALAALKHHERTEGIASAAETLEERYDAAMDAIELLQTRLDLCMLSFPERGGASYEGIIREQSLTDKNALENVTTLRRFEKGQERFHHVRLNEKQIEKIGTFLAEGPAYMHFWESEGDENVVVFKEKAFRWSRGDEEELARILRYASSKGISPEALHAELSEPGSATTDRD